MDSATLTTTSEVRSEVQTEIPQSHEEDVNKIEDTRFKKRNMAKDIAIRFLKRVSII